MARSATRSARTRRHARSAPSLSSHLVTPRGASTLSAERRDTLAGGSPRTEAIPSAPSAAPSGTAARSSPAPAPPAVPRCGRRGGGRLAPRAGRPLPHRASLKHGRSRRGPASGWRAAAAGRRPRRAGGVAWGARSGRRGIRCGLRAAQPVASGGRSVPGRGPRPAGAAAVRRRHDVHAPRAPGWRAG